MENLVRCDFSGNWTLAHVTLNTPSLEYLSIVQVPNIVIFQQKSEINKLRKLRHSKNPQATTERFIFEMKKQNKNMVTIGVEVKKILVKPRANYVNKNFERNYKYGYDDYDQDTGYDDEYY